MKQLKVYAMKLQTIACLSLVYFSTATNAHGQGTGGGSAGIDPIPFENPLMFDNFVDLIEAILTIVVVIAVPLIVLAIIYAGFMFVTAQGNPEKLSTAKTALLYALVGGLIILGSWAITQMISNLVDAFRR